MKTIKALRLLILFAAVFLVLALVVACRANEKEAMISTFGKYQGYSEAVYDGTQRTSDYLTLSDGTRLAYDLIIPTKKGSPADKPLPALFKYTPYDRAWRVFDKDGKFNLGGMGLPWYYELMARFRAWVAPHGNLWDATFRTKWLGDMLKSGYAVIVVDRPGTGASFGTLANEPSAVASEADQILNWIAAQPWCDGNIGMFGDSIQAQIQFQAASTGNPHLKAILPATTWMDNYSAVVFPGGVPDIAFLKLYPKLNKAFNSLATPVDQDKDGSLLAQARAKRGDTSTLATQAEGAENAVFRDILTPDGQNLWIDHEALYPLLDRINRSRIPVYLIDGWYDIYARDDFLIYANLTVPKRLLVRPTDHAGIEAAAGDVDYGAEAHRWFDHWLKRIDNGIMDEPPIHYYLQGVDKQQAWQSTKVWPLRNQVMTRYYLGPGKSAKKASINDGSLDPSLPADSQTFDAYTVDYSTTTGTSPHWTGLATAHKYPNMRSHDAKALTYTTPPLEAAANVAGHPVVHLWLRTGAPDLDVFVYLEQVDRNGNSTYITQGDLRASHRALSLAPFDNFGLPWHNHFQRELQLIPAGEPVELVFDLLPTAWRFSSGSRIRTTVAFADTGNFDTPVLDPAPALDLLRDAAYPSYVDLPFVKLP
jgi:putative CocE/NonD family hydrolase